MAKTFIVPAVMKMNAATMRSTLCSCGPHADHLATGLEVFISVGISWPELVSAETGLTRKAVRSTTWHRPSLRYMAQERGGGYLMMRAAEALCDYLDLLKP
jgi:hypothetical protein